MLNDSLLEEQHREWENLDKPIEERLGIKGPIIPIGPLFEDDV
jgi:hypothetical protein